MMTKGEKIAELIDALDEGFILHRNYQKDPEMDCFAQDQYAFKAGNSYEIKGWASAYMTAENFIFHLVENPHEWSIFLDFNMNKDDYPFPWSVKWEEKK